MKLVYNYTSPYNCHSFQTAKLAHWSYPEEAKACWELVEHPLALKECFDVLCYEFLHLYILKTFQTCRPNIKVVLIIYPWPTPHRNHASINHLPFSSSPNKVLGSINTGPRIAQISTKSGGKKIALWETFSPENTTHKTIKFFYKPPSHLSQKSKIK